MGPDIFDELGTALFVVAVVLLAIGALATWLLLWG